MRLFTTIQLSILTLRFIKLCGKQHTTVSKRAYYTFNMRLLPAVMSMTQRGVRVNDELRQERLRALGAEAERIRESVLPIVEGVQERLQEKDLLWETRVCKRCRNGVRKRVTCVDCGGAGKHTSFVFNVNSKPQLADVLYNGLKLPRRSNHGKTTVDEEALKSLLALDKSGFVERVLRHNKLDTMRKTYERISPHADYCPLGSELAADKFRMECTCTHDFHVRTVFNPAGTYTGRFSSSEAFYVPASTNLQNLPAEEAKRDPLFAVRDCIVPDPGEVFLYADLSQAEARVSAVLSEDWDLLSKWADPHWDVHKWTAAAVFDKSESSIGDRERFLGKKCRHALNYGMGPNKFWRTVNDVADLTGVAITMKEAKAIWKAYHELHPKLDSIWWNRVQATLEARQPMVASHCGWECSLWPRFEETGELNHESLRAGIAWEPQHTVAHILNEGLLELFDAEDGSYKVLLQAHDAVLLGVRRDSVQHVAKLAKRILERPQEIAGRRLLIPAEVFECVDNWSGMRRIL